MFYYGTDPEFFAVTSQGVISPALFEKYGLLKPIYNDSEFKHPIYFEKRDWRWLQDGVAFELNFKGPFNNYNRLYHSVHGAVTFLEEQLHRIKFDGEKISLYKKPVVGINTQLYLPFLEDNKIRQGFIFGCDPDQDAIVPDYKCQTIDVETHPFRYGGGHFHLSGINELYNFPIPSVKLLAITVGNFCTANSLYPELDRQRVLTYGRPGRYRQQRYAYSRGIEYRSPSNSWLSLSIEKFEELIYWADRACYFLMRPSVGKEIIKNFLDKTVESITNSNQELAQKILLDIKQ